jgi:3-hydroxyisobutyrate dehydrogenase-like beta-hydroxyacid dehydrogenase
MSVTIGFLGTGGLGAPMASNLIATGNTVRVWNRSRARAEAIAGATVTDTPRSAAAGADFVITMLADDAAVEGVTFGAEGLLPALGAEAMHISMSTISVASTRRLVEAHAGLGRGFIAAPVFGRPDAAAAKLLWIVPGGPAELVARAAPVFAALGQGTFPQAAAEQAALLKLIGNFMIGATIETLGEALVLAEKGGLDPEQALAMLTGTLFSAPIYRNYGPRIARTEFTPAGFKLGLGLKDLRLVLEAARDTGTPMPLAELVRDRMSEALRVGRGDHDIAGFVTVIREDAGLEPRR